MIYRSTFLTHQQNVWKWSENPQNHLPRTIILSWQSEYASSYITIYWNIEGGFHICIIVNTLHNQFKVVGVFVEQTIEDTFLLNCLAVPNWRPSGTGCGLVNWWIFFRWFFRKVLRSYACDDGMRKLVNKVLATVDSLKLYCLATSCHRCFKK